MVRSDVVADLIVEYHDFVVPAKEMLAADVEIPSELLHQRWNKPRADQLRRQRRPKRRLIRTQLSEVTIPIGQVQPHRTDFLVAMLRTAHPGKAIISGES